MTGVVSDSPPSRLERLEEIFRVVELGATFTCLDCMPYGNDLPIWIGRGLKGSLPELWPEARHFQ